MSSEPVNALTNTPDKLSQNTHEKPSVPGESMPKLPSVTTIPGPNRMPGGKPKRLGARWYVIAAAAAIVIAGVTTYFVMRSYGSAHVELATHVVKLDRLELTVVERGTLESSDNRDVYCRVKSGAKNSTVSTTIKSVIDDGSTVKKGDLICDLDDSGLIEQLKDKKIALDKAESDKIQAEEQYKIQVSKNESDIKTAEVALELARIDKQKYSEGDYPQALKDCEGKIKVAEGDVEQQRDRAAWSQRMVKKGYQTVSQLQAEQSKLESLEITLAGALEAKRVLTDSTFGTKKRNETSNTNAVLEAERALARVKISAGAEEVKARVLRETNRSLYQQALTAYHDCEEEIRKCKITAPQDGMVVYYIPEQARFGGGSQQSIVAQGEPVREGQKLMQIPDLRHMVVNTKVHEAMVSRVHSGQKAKVRIDAFPNRTFPGHITSVATISAQSDFMAADVKVYTTKVAIDEDVAGLKPGMSAEVTITVGDALENVLTIPVQAIEGSVEMGGKRRCYVLTPNGPQSREIVVGLSNDRVAEVREGLTEGELVVTNPKTVTGANKKSQQGGAAADGKDKEGGGEPKGKRGDKKGPPSGSPGADFPKGPQGN